MPVKHTAPTGEQTRQMNAYARQNAEEVATHLVENSDFLKSLDLPDNQASESAVLESGHIKDSGDAVDRLLRKQEQEQTPKKKTPQKAEEEEEEDEDEESEIEENEDEEASHDQDEEDEDDELIPQSKVNKRIARLQAKNRALEAQLQAQKQGDTQASDPDQAKLDKMTPVELKSLKRQVMREFKNTDDPQVEQRLLDLQEKIDETIVRGPERFAQKQVSAFKTAAVEIMEDYELSEEQFAEIKQVAETIYGKSLAMQKAEQGQAEALYLAHEYWMQAGKKPAKSSDKSMKRKLNKMKRKVSLDGKVVKGDMPQSNLRQLRTRAKQSGSEHDKLDYFIKSGMAGDLQGMVDRQLGKKGR